MADSDNEDERFCNTVMNELAAFSITKKPDNDAADDDDDADCPDMPDTLPPDLLQEAKLAESKHPAPQSMNNEERPKTELPHQSEMSSNSIKDESSDTSTPLNSDPPKPPARLLRLSRPLQPYVSARSSLSQSDSRLSTSLPMSSSSSLSSSTPAVSSTSASASSTASTSSTSSLTSNSPGSRLAALQRPGSPMQRILQRAQSPALAASMARLSKVTSDKTANASEQKAAADEEDNGEVVTNGESEASSSPLLQTLPAKLPSSSLTSSILSRRPQSPLTSGRASLLLIHKQTSSTNPSENGGQPSPRSAVSDEQNNTDPNMSPSSDSAEEEKRAIRNKLRANSFRLKNLLTKRPAFSRSEENTASNDEAQGVKLTEPSSLHSKDNTDEIKPVEADGNKSAIIGNRTRWRTEGTGRALLARSKSNASERVNTLISARTLRTRSKIDPENPEVKESRDVLPITKKASSIAVSDNISNKVSQSDKSSIDQDKDKPDVDAVGARKDNRISGATLIRSPRTRTQLPITTVPSPDKDRISAHSEPSISSEKQGLSSEISEKIVQSVSDLEKEKEANLVFDSEKFSSASDVVQEVKPESVIPQITQSMYGGSLTSSQSSQLKPHIVSEPSTPIDAPNMRNSVSCENNLQDAEFMRSSPALKRSLAVTDLDKAMRDRDQMKLSSLFKDAAGDRTSNEATSQHTAGLSSGLGNEGFVAPNKESAGEMETDLDAQKVNTNRPPRSPGLQQRMTQSLDDKYSPPPTPTSLPTPPVNAVAPMVYKPNVNLEDAVKWPIDLPGKLDLRKMEVFEGMMLMNWLSGSIDKSHYLRLVMTKHDINVIISQVCTCLIAAGVMGQLEAKNTEDIFKTDCMYYWTHTQTPVQQVNQDVNKLQPVWPPTQEDVDHKPGLKYTEAEHQAAMVTLRHEYKEEVEKVQTENKGVLDRARDEYQLRLQQAFERIALLQKEVEKYKCLAGIEELSQNALSEAQAAQQESGLPPEGVQNNGFSTPHMDPNQQQMSSLTPDCVSGDVTFPAGQSPQELFSDLTMPAELQQDGQAEGVSEGLSAPPPAPPPPPETMIPPPPAPPPPPDLMAFNKKALKPIVNPISPMKPLFWNRIQVQDIKVPRNKEYIDKHLVWEEIKEEQVDISELDQLFSKSTNEHSRRFNFNKPKNKAKQPAKVISPKRSQTIGILLSSLRIEMSDIEYAILNFDTSQLSEEKLRQIYECRGDQDEIKKLNEHIKKHPDVPLDKPDQFMYDLSQIPEYSERIFCFIFREAFQESISVIDTKLTNLRMTCQTLTSGSSIKRILGLVLALGNYMNGGHRQRGQADGFGIDILPKLKDVKSKDNAISLLQFTVQQYVKKYEGKDAGTDRVKVPVPDHSDMHQASLVNFDEIDKELKRIRKDFDAAQARARKVIEKSEELCLQPFKDIMMRFFEKGEQEFTEQEENLTESKKIFHETVIFFCVKPSSGNKVVTSEYFFTLWSVFCQDFRDCWKREHQRLIKQKIRDHEREVKLRKENVIAKKAGGRVRTRKAGGLKDRLATKGVLESGPP